MGVISYIQGDIRNTKYSIAHGVNCQNTMGSGVAKALFNKWPEVKDSYHRSFNQLSKDMWRSKLGHYQIAYLDDRLVYNCFTQLTYGYDGTKRVNYAAIANCLSTIAKTGIKNLAIPKIGCGLAGGDWNIVEQILLDIIEIYPEFNIYVYTIL